MKAFELKPKLSTRRCSIYSVWSRSWTPCASTRLAREIAKRNLGESMLNEWKEWNVG